MLFQRYASPMVIVEKMIITGRFAEFVDEVIRLRNNELEEKTQWEFFLHKVYDMTFREFLNTFEADGTQASEYAMTENRKAEIVNESQKILNSFC